MAQSPRVNASDSTAPTLMDWPTAQRAVIGGRSITKLEWNKPDDYGVLRNEKLMLRLDGEWKLWIVSEADMIGRDWVVR